MGLTNQRKIPVVRNCAYCNQPFKIETFQLRLCCNRSCSAKYRYVQSGNPPWDCPKGQIELLEDLAGALPRHEIATEYNRRAKRKGFPIRSETAVIVQLKRIGQSQQTIEDNWRMSTLAGLLEVHRDRIRTWVHGSPRNGVRVGGLLSYRKVSNMTIISKRDFQDFAQRYPEKLKGIHPANLLFILEDKDLVYKIIQLGEPTTGRKHRLIRVDTGEGFSSASDAAKAVYGNSKHILKRTKAGKKAYGIEFRIVEIEGARNYLHLVKNYMPESVVRQEVYLFHNQGVASKEIAKRLEISPRKVEYILSIGEKKCS